MKIAFKSCALILGAVTLLTACGGERVSSLVGTGAEIPEYENELRELPESEALSFVKDMKIGWNLGNTLDADKKTSVEQASETAWGSPVITEEMIDDIYRAGFNTVRIPVTWHTHVDENLNISDYWVGRVKEIVDYAYKRKMYVIINIHHDIVKDYYYPSYESLENSLKFSKAVWSRLCETFKDYDEHLIFESINEPRLKGTDNEWWLDTKSELAKESIDCIMQCNQAFVDTVRASGGKNETRYLMTPSYCASPIYACDELFSLPDDPSDKIILSVHAYEPNQFALSGDMNADAFAAGRSGTSIKNVMDILYEKYTSKGIAVVIGEFGSRNKNENLEARIDHAAYYVSEARAAGITCVWWDNNAFTGNGELFGLYDRNEMEWKYPDIAIALMKNCE